MDILRFINSKDIRNHLKGINYQFNTLEAAWLIYQSTNYTLYEKLDAFEELMQCYPDCEVKERVNTRAQESLFEYLKKYIETYKALINEISSNGIYTVEVWCNSIDEPYSYTVNQLFSNYNSAVEQCRLEYDEYDKVYKYCIKKMPIFEKALDEYYCLSQIELRANDCKIMDVCYGDEYREKYDLIGDVFVGLWFDFPTPFKAGDIVWDVTRKINPCVLYSIGFEDMGEKFFESRKYNGDVSDMNYGAYYALDDGSVFSDTSWNYMDLEYYTDKLENEEKVLKPISYLLKDKIDIGLCVNAINVLGKRLSVEKSIPLGYTEDILAELGISNKEG